MKKLFLLTVLVMGFTSIATAGPIDWCFEQVGFVPEKKLFETTAKLEVARTEVRLINEFNQRLQSMVSNANIMALVSFGVACLLVGIFVEGIRKALKSLWSKFEKKKPEEVTT
jgi:hypothetical protein